MNSIILLLSIFVFTFSCVSAEEKSRGKLSVLISVDFPPFEYYERIGLNMELKGFDVDLAHRIAEHLDLDLEVRDVDFETIVPQLMKQRDVIAISAITVTEGRKKYVDFSIPYYYTNVGVLRHKHTQLDLIHEFEGVLGVRIGSGLEHLAETYQADHPKLQIKYYYRMKELLADLDAYKIDGILIEDTPGETYEHVHKWQHFFVPIQNERQAYAIAFPKGSKLRVRVNEIIRQLDHTGVLTEMHRRWFTFPTSRYPRSDVAPVL